MKKLLAMLAAGGLLALTTGCPPAASTPPAAPAHPGGSSAGGTTPPAHTGTPETGHGGEAANTPKKLTGKLVSAGDNKLSFKDESDKDHTDVDAKGAMVMRDGKDAKLSDLKAGDKVTVTMKGDLATEVDATGEAKPEPKPDVKPDTKPDVKPPADTTKVTTDKDTTASGKVVSVEKDKVTVSVDGKDKTYTVPADAKVTIDGKDDKLENVKKDQMVTVTAKGDEATKVEAKTK